MTPIQARHMVTVTLIEHVQACCPRLPRCDTCELWAREAWARARSEKLPALRNGTVLTSDTLTHIMLLGATA